MLKEDDLQYHALIGCSPVLDLSWQYRMTRNTGNPTPTAEETQALTTMIGQSDTPELQTLRCLSELTTSQLTVSLVCCMLNFVVVADTMP